MLDPVVQQVWVQASPSEAFHRFTAELDAWWPKARHSVSRERCARVRFGAGVGEHVTEVDADGAEHVWGTIRVWNAPARVVFTWHPGRPAEQAQEVEVTFEPERDGTLVRLEHRGWEALGTEAAETRGRYVTGWVGVLDRFAVPRGTGV